MSKIYLKWRNGCRMILYDPICTMGRGAERIDRYEFVYMYIYICIDIFWKDT